MKSKVFQTVGCIFLERLQAGNLKLITLGSERVDRIPSRLCRQSTGKEGSGLREGSSTRLPDWRDELRGPRAPTWEYWLPFHDGRFLWKIGWVNTPLNSPVRPYDIELPPKLRARIFASMRISVRICLPRWNLCMRSVPGIPCCLQIVWFSLKNNNSTADFRALSRREI